MQNEIEIDVYLNRTQLQYLVDLVFQDDVTGGPLISVEMLGILGEALNELDQAVAFMQENDES